MKSTGDWWVAPCAIRLKGPGAGEGGGFDKDMAPRAKCERHDWPARERV